MIVGVPKETFPGEKRVALIPAAVAPLVKLKLEVRVEAGAGAAAGYPDAQYEQKGAKIVADRREALAADIVLQVRTAGSNPAGAADTEALRSGQIVVGHADPLSAGAGLKGLADKGVTLLAMELVPRITRAQAMDALSSQANLAGYKAVLMAADRLPKIFPLLMTAAGTLQPAKVLVLGAGVAGLQAIGVAKKLGGVVSAWDVRPVVKEQIQSVGGKWADLGLDTAGAEDKGGYAKALSADQEKAQREALARIMGGFDVVITTALIPGRPAPKLITADAVKNMQPGSVIVDLAAERGGNCELTEPDQVVERHGVTIIGTTNIPSLVANHASQMYAGNLVKLLELIVAKDGSLKFDVKDEIIAGMLVSKDGQVVNARARAALGLEPLLAPAAPAPAAAATPAAPSAAPVPAAAAPATTPAPAPAQPPG